MTYLWLLFKFTLSKNWILVYKDWIVWYLRIYKYSIHSAFYMRHIFIWVLCNFFGSIKTTYDLAISFSKFLDRLPAFACVKAIGNNIMHLFRSQCFEAFTFFFSFFLSGFSFTDTDNSQDSRGRERTILFHSATSTRSRTIRHLFATLHVRWLSHIFYLSVFYWSWWFFLQYGLFSLDFYILFNNRILIKGVLMPKLLKNLFASYFPCCIIE